MNATILLSGYLTTERLREARRELVRYEERIGDGHSELTLVIASEGGEAEAAIAFGKRVQKSPLYSRAKIYCAKSAGALIAMMTKEREIVRDGVFTVNLGSAEIDSSTLITPEKVPAPIVEQAKRLRATVFDYLHALGFPKEGPYMQKLLTQNRLTLTAEECHTLGLVKRII